MNCNKCGKELRSGDIFCGACGNQNVAENTNMRIPDYPKNQNKSKQNKIFGFIVGGAILLLCLGLIGHMSSTPSKQKTPDSSSQEQRPNVNKNNQQYSGTALEQEAVAIFKKHYVDMEIIRCGDYTYWREPHGDGEYYRIYKIKSDDPGEFKITPSPLSEIDKMNGWEWRGSLEFRMTKSLCQRKLDHEKVLRWGDWDYCEVFVGYHGPYLGGANLGKRNGAWRDTSYRAGPNEFGYRYRNWKRFTCEDAANMQKI
jgi:hypothetical protein